ncbi:MAG: efflux RND transporter periplasmic adaptor subunit [Bacteroidales bacterium]
MNKLNIGMPIIMILSMMACRQTETEAEKTNLADSPTRVSVIHPEKRKHQQSWQLAGTLRPWKEANLGTSIPGRVEKIYTGEGQWVEQGTLVAKLSAEPALMAKVEYETLKTDFERVQRLLEKGSITRQEFDHVQGQYKAAKAKYELMEKNTMIRAPFPGKIMEILINEGETFFFHPALTPGVSHAPGIVRIMQTRPLKTVVNIPEHMIPKLEQMQEITIASDLYPEKQFPGKILKLTPLVSENSRTAPLEIQVDTGDETLMPGMFVKVTLRFISKEYFFVPRHTVVNNVEQNPFVWTIRDGNIAQKTAIRQLFIHDGYAAIEGVQENTKIVTAGSNQLKEGSTVEVKAK